MGTRKIQEAPGPRRKHPQAHRPVHRQQPPLQRGLSARRSGAVDHHRGRDRLHLAYGAWHPGGVAGDRPYPRGGLGAAAAASSQREDGLCLPGQRDLPGRFERRAQDGSGPFRAPDTDPACGSPPGRKTRERPPGIAGAVWSRRRRGNPRTDQAPRRPDPG